MNSYLVKSLEEDHATKILSGEKKVTLQTLDEILKTGILKPNTKSFGQKKRLSVTIIHKNYTKTYRPQGIIFQTKAKPDFVLPFDLVLLSDAEKIVVHYYRIKDRLHIYYNHKLIEGYQRFIFRDIEGVIKRFKSPKAAWKALNEFRKKHDREPLPKSKYRLAEYNEAMFFQPIKIRPIGLFGYRAETRKAAKRLGLRYFRTAKDFYNRLPNK